MSKFWNWRCGRWEVDNESDARELKMDQPEPVYVLNRETGQYKEFKIKTKVRSPRMRHGQFTDKKGSYKEDIWD